MVTQVGDENGQAAIAEEKPKLEIPSQPAPSTAPVSYTHLTLPTKLEV
ncbi:hypothetical protein PVA38_10980 [Streptococcus pneumoniae D39]|nr:hypothetical protein PVA38_10980 [Streptococcus pneumoniae D39]